MLQEAKSKNVLLFVTYSNYKTKHSSFLFDIFLLFLITYLFPHMKSVFYFPKSCSPDQETMNTKLCDKIDSNPILKQILQLCLFCYCFFSLFQKQFDWLKKR